MPLLFVVNHRDVLRLWGYRLTEPVFGGVGGEPLVDLQPLPVAEVFVSEGVQVHIGAPVVAGGAGHRAVLQDLEARSLGLG